jgi:hypothetical protein
MSTVISDGAGYTSLRTVLESLARGNASRSVTGTKRSGPVGIESIIEYRSGLPIYLNVADWIDTFMVYTIDGIDGADIRSGAQPNPGGQGETPTEALWGGRSLVLTGKLYAQTIWKLRDMEQGLRGSFIEINKEYPLIFHAVDPTDDLMLRRHRVHGLQQRQLPSTDDNRVEGSDDEPAHLERG